MCKLAKMAAITLGSLVCNVSLYALEIAELNGLGAHVTFIEDDDTAVGLTYSRDLTERNRVFIQAETMEFENEAVISTEDIQYSGREKLDSNEIEVGFLRRVSSPVEQFGFFIGPSIGFQMTDGTFENTTEDSTGTYIRSGKIEMDTSVNFYANAMADYTWQSGVRVYGMFSYGYTGGTDGKLKYDTGTRPTENIETDSDTFWNIALGAGFAF